MRGQPHKLETALAVCITLEVNFVISAPLELNIAVGTVVGLNPKLAVIGISPQPPVVAAII